MPELPEVETVCRGLAPLLEGQVIEGAEAFRPNLRYPFPDGLVERLAGRRVLSVTRRAKYLLWALSDGEVLVSHLGMTGKWLYYPEEQEEYARHDHLLLRLQNGAALVYNDARRFGFVDLIAQEGWQAHRYFADLGPEPLNEGGNEAFTGSYLVALSRGRRQPVKPFLMDQRVVVGVGNIYACEALHRVGVHPEQMVGSINRKCYRALAEVVVQVLQEAIASGGSTLRDFVRSSGDSGYFQHHFAVYGREGKPCLACEQPVARVVQAGRSSFFCSRCQPLRRQKLLTHTRSETSPEVGG